MNRITTWSCLLAAAALLGACRTYGGYGSEEATYEQIQRVVERFGKDLSRARGDLEALERASAQGPVLEALAGHFARLVAAHEAVLETHRRTASELSPSSTYRSLSRSYGAMVTQQRLMRRQYQDLLRHVYEGHAPDTVVTAAERRPYALVPPYYVRSANADRELTVNQVVSRVQTGTPRLDFRLMSPASPSGEEEAADPAAH